MFGFLPRQIRKVPSHFLYLVGLEVGLRLFSCQMHTFLAKMPQRGFSQSVPVFLLTFNQNQALVLQKENVFVYGVNDFVQVMLRFDFILRCLTVGNDCFDLKGLPNVIISK